MNRLRWLLVLLLAHPLGALAQTQSVALPVASIAAAPALGQVLPVVLNEQTRLAFQTPPISSPYWIAVDFSSRTVIGKSGENARIEPASMTKVLTAYLVFQALRDGKISEQDRLFPKKFTEGSRMFLDERVEVTIGELIRGMIIQSGNDASITLAERIAGNETLFAKQMNAVATSLGMTHSKFRNSTGLPDPEHYSTPEDLAKLAIAMIRDFPEQYTHYASREYRYNNITQPNRNALLWRNIGADGMKTGHTDSAGYCLMASAIRGQRRIITVTAKAQTEQQRFADNEGLIHAVYDHTETIKLYQREQVVEKVAVWKGDSNEVSIGFADDLMLTLPRDKTGALSAVLHYDQPVLAPIAIGQKIGDMQLSIDGAEYAKFPVVALQEVGKASWMARAWDTFRLMLQ